MDIECICVGKLKEKYLKQGIAEYTKRMTGYSKLTWVELADEPTQQNMSEVEIEQTLLKEAERIESRLASNRKVIVLAIEGELITSEALAQTLQNYGTYGSSKVTFIIGGSLGLHPSVKDKADWMISLGRITMPHQLTRLVLAEQIYRAFRINHGHSYHK